MIILSKQENMQYVVSDYELFFYVNVCITSGYELFMYNFQLHNIIKIKQRN